MSDTFMKLIGTKQVDRARLLARCLAGLLAVNLLTVGIASWNRMSLGSVAPEAAEAGQLTAALPPEAVIKKSAVPSKVDLQISTQAKTGPSVPAIAKHTVPSGDLPELSIPTPSAFPSADALEDGMKEAFTSLQSLLAECQEALAAIPFAAPANKPGSYAENLSVPEVIVEEPQEGGTPATKQASVVIRLVNPRDSGGEVSYQVDGAIFTLRPGEYQELPVGEEYRIEFHRGGDFGDASLGLREGAFEFGVGNRGWMLDAAQKVLDGSLRQAY